MKSVFGDNRIAQILQFFCRTPSVPVSFLAERLDVSERTIRNDIKQLNQELEGCAVIEGRQGKYGLRIYDNERFQTVCAHLLETDDFLNSPHNRMDYIFGRLMRTERPLLTDELAYEMNVGRTTLVSDLKKLRTALEPYHLSIVGKTSKGLVLEGGENSIRQYVLENAYETLYGQYPLDAEILEIVTDTFQQSPLEKNVLHSFLRFLTVMLDRFLTGHTIGPLSAAFYNLTARPEYRIADQMLDRIGQFLRIEFPAEEKLFVLLPIIGMRTPADVQDMRSIELDESMRPLMEKVFRQIRLEMDIKIESPEFIEEFLYHLMFMINRLRFRVQLKNPMLDELRDKYPLAWKMAGVAARVIHTAYGLDVSEDERGYLASYFGVFLEESELKKKKPFRAAVVCGTGRVTARLVAAQLRKVLDSTAELSLYADEKVTPELLDTYDIVFTTVELPCRTERPVIRIHEVFNEQELRHKIEKARYWDQVDVPILDNNWFVMAGMLEENRFFRFEPTQTYDEAVAHMAETLVANGQADPGFLERLRMRERKGTMVFDHEVAIPHSVQYAVDRLILAVGVFPTPIRYQEHEIRVIFLLGLPEQITSDDGLLIRVYDEIIRITQDAALLDKIARADCFPALLRALYRQAGGHT